MKAQTRIGHHINHLIFGIDSCVESKSWLDVGCGDGVACTTMELNRFISYKVGVDPKAWVNDNEKDPKALFTDETDWIKYRVKYNEDCPIWNDHFDIVTCLDTIEHLPKEEGETWLDHFEEVADRLIIIFTPDGFLPQGPEQGEKFDELEKHRSGWEAEDFLKRGYCVYRTPKDFHHNPTGVEGDWPALLAFRNFAVRPK